MRYAGFVVMILVGLVSTGCGRTKIETDNADLSVFDPEDAEKTFRWLVAEHTNYLANPSVAGNAIDAERREKAWEKKLSDVAAARPTVNWKLKVGSVPGDSRLVPGSIKRDGVNRSDANGTLRTEYKLSVASQPDSAKGGSPTASFPVAREFHSWLTTAKSGDAITIRGTVSAIVAVTLNSVTTKDPATGRYETLTTYGFSVRIAEPSRLEPSTH